MTTVIQAGGLGKRYRRGVRVDAGLFKFLVMGPATLLLPPRVFYKLRGWYGKQDLGRFRDRVCRTERATPHTVTK
jgi:hypothetical protein